MKHAELIEDGAIESQCRGVLVEEDSILIAPRVSKNPKVMAVEMVWFRGVSFFVFIRSCIINELSEGD